MLPKVPGRRERRRGVAKTYPSPRDFDFHSANFRPTPASRTAGPISRGPLTAAVHPLVLLPLLAGHRDQVFRPAPDPLADITRLERHYRLCAIHQHANRQIGSAPGSVADIPALCHAFLRFQFLGAGEGTGLFPDLFAEPLGDRGRDCALRRFGRRNTYSTPNSPR